MSKSITKQELNSLIKKEVNNILNEENNYSVPLLDKMANLIVNLDKCKDMLYEERAKFATGKLKNEDPDIIKSVIIQMNKISDDMSKLKIQFHNINQF